MINTREAVVLREERLPDHGAGGATVYVLRQPNGKIILKRRVDRGKVLNFIDRYEMIINGVLKVHPLDEQYADSIVNRLLKGEPWSAALVFGIGSVQALKWERTESEHKYTSTGIKFWRHKQQMESYRENHGHTVISTHISPEGACNLKCPYCSVTYRDTHSRIALPRIQKYVLDLKSRGLKAVIFTGGGEPTLYPDFNHLVQWTKAQGLSVALITNGTMSSKVSPETWKCFSWVRVSINVFDGWRDKIKLPYEKLASDCVVGCSMVYTLEHEATQEKVPLDRLELFRHVSRVADQCGAKYIRVLPNCLLPQGQLLLQHQSIKAIADKLGDTRFFHQYKIHGAPKADRCHQARFRPYLSEEPWHRDGEPGTVYPCDSVVLNNSVAHFAEKFQICKPEKVLDFLDEWFDEKFDPRTDCTGCVFTENVNMLDDWLKTGEGHFTDEPLVHEEFV